MLHTLLVSLRFPVVGAASLLFFLASQAPLVASPVQGESVNGFPKWEERVFHQWMNRARCDPQVEMTACGSNCSEAACYTPQPPLAWSLGLNRASRFHCDEMAAQGFYGHDSICNLVSNINSLYPGSCTGAASCACVGGTSTCGAGCTSWGGRAALFGANTNFQLLGNGFTDPTTVFNLMLYEPNTGTNCSFGIGNSHRYSILMSSGGVGAGFSSMKVTVNMGANETPGKIPSGSHYPRNASTVNVWANWYDASAPTEALVNVDGINFPLSLARGTPQNGAWTASIGPGMDSGCHRYYFVFRSGGTTYTYPGTGSLGIGPSGSCADWNDTRPLNAPLICPGDGSAGACPCANNGATGRGCRNSQNVSGAILTANGTVQPDTVVLTSTGELPSSISIFLQGNVFLNPSLVFGDGRRCAGGALKRISTRNAIGGTVSYPSVGDPSITARSAMLGDPISAGSQRYYQVYYRDGSPTFCPAPAGNTFNASNGRSIVW